MCLRESVAPGTLLGTLWGERANLDKQTGSFSIRAPKSVPDPHEQEPSDGEEPQTWAPDPSGELVLNLHARCVFSGSDLVRAGAEASELKPNAVVEVWTVFGQETFRVQTTTAVSPPGGEVAPTR